MKTFQELGWGSSIQRGGRYPDDVMTGFFLHPHTAHARRVQAAIQSTGLPAEVAPKIDGVDDAHQHLEVVILGKPLPSVIPESVKREMTDLEKRLTELSQQIVTFAQDRSRENQHIRNTTHGDSNKTWETQVAFTKETEALLIQRFGERLTSLLADLSALGIELPFHVRASAGHSPIGLGRFLGVMGSLIGPGRIQEARTTAKDRNLWFHQGR